MEFKDSASRSLNLNLKPNNQKGILVTFCGLDGCGKTTLMKKFIEYLEDLIKQNETVVEVSKYGLPKNCSKLLIDFYKEILSKYKEIIGDIKSENK